MERMATTAEERRRARIGRPTLPVQNLMANAYHNVLLRYSTPVAHVDVSHRRARAQASISFSPSQHAADWQPRTVGTENEPS